MATRHASDEELKRMATLLEVSQASNAGVWVTVSIFVGVASLIGFFGGLKMDLEIGGYWCRTIGPILVGGFALWKLCHDWKHEAKHNSLAAKDHENGKVTELTINAERVMLCTELPLNEIKAGDTDDIHAECYVEHDGKRITRLAGQALLDALVEHGKIANEIRVSYWPKTQVIARVEFSGGDVEQVKWNDDLVVEPMPDWCEFAGTMKSLVKSVAKYVDRLDSKTGQVPLRF